MMNRFSPLLALLVACMLSPLMTVHAAEKTLFSPNDVNRQVGISSPALSPDGKWVIYSVDTADEKTDEYQSRLWRVRFDGNERTQLLHTPDTSSSSPEWFPDGKSIAFLRYQESSDEDKEEGPTQVWIMTADGGQPRQITHFPAGVEDFVISPDGKRLAVIALDPKYPPNTDPPLNPAPFVTDRYLFKNDSQGWLGSRYKHLYVVDIVSGKATQITHGKHDDYLPSWSPDGHRIAYVSRRDLAQSHNPNWHVYVIDAHSGANEQPLTVEPGDNGTGRPAWSPDGKSIAYLNSVGGKWFTYAPSQLAVIDVASRKARLVAPDDRWFTSAKWSPDGRSIYGLVTQDESKRLVRVAVASGEITELTRGNRMDVNLSVSRNDHVVVLSGEDSHPSNLYALDQGTLRLLTDHNEWLSGKQLASTEAIHYKSADGTEIHALLMKPIGYVEGKRYPTIVRLHGGPVDQFSHSFNLLWQVYAANGYVVLGVNPRGSTGRGFDFARAIYADWGNKDTQDVLAGVDHIVELGIADPARLGVGGWSYGGILTNQVIARTQRFKAAISGAGSSNMYGTYGVDQYVLDYELELGTPWGNREVWDRVSYPFFHADRIVTPTMFQCGEKDFNVPCAGSEQMYQALRSQNVLTTLVIYPGQHHSFSVPSYAFEIVERDLAWYDRFLKPAKGKPVSLRH